MERKNQRIRKNLQRKRRNLPRNPSTQSTPTTTPILRHAVRYPAKHGKSNSKPRRSNQRHPRTRTLLQPYLFKGWQYQQTAKKAVEQETRRYLRRKYVSQNQITFAEMDVLYEKIIDDVKSYA